MTAFLQTCPSYVAIGQQNAQDIFAVRTLLNAAGVASLDDAAGTIAGMNNSTRRYNGKEPEDWLVRQALITALSCFAGIVLLVDILYGNYYASSGVLK
jgi:hypothetical protein